ncbi:MAG: tripartite tricarboxylate transporter substrate binding protein, partial [Rhizobiales bacterium]|nr:tripartite tricarboxylate transporter substrate binding protein [Hyphomicrobiales bacterium]
MKYLLKVGVVAIATFAAGAASADFPNDKPIKFVVPYSAGGGFDTIVRTFAPELEKALGATVVPANIKGASGTRGGQAISRAKADGYTIGIYNIPGLTVSQTLGRKLGFDLDAVSWIANLAQSKYGIAVKGDSDIKSIKDLCDLGRPIKLSDTGKDTTSSITSVIAFHIIGCDIVNVTGYSGSNDTMIAVMRGEVDATLKPISTLMKYTTTDDLRMIVTFTDETAVEGVPSTTELGYPELAKFGLNRVVGGPPNMSAELIEKLAVGFKAAVDSDPIQKWADGTNTTLTFMNSDETKA